MVDAVDEEGEAEGVGEEDEFLGGEVLVVYLWCFSYERVRGVELPYLSHVRTLLSHCC